MSKKKTLTIVVICLLLTATLAVSISAYLDRATGYVGGYFTEGLIYNGLYGGYHASTYVNPNANRQTIWAKVELVTSGTHPTASRYGSSNSVDTAECTSSSYVASIRGYHYVKLTTGETWGDYYTCYTSYIT